MLSGAKRDAIFASIMAHIRTLVEDNLSIGRATSSPDANVLNVLGKIARDFQITPRAVIKWCDWHETFWPGSVAYAEPLWRSLSEEEVALDKRTKVK
jgi:hypothetical protein